MATKPVSKPSKRMHYYLMAGEVVWLDVQNQAEFRRGFNTLLINEKQRLNRKSLGETQQAMQIRFMKEFTPEGIKIIDVFIINAVYLGHMTQEEFNEGFSEDQPSSSKPEPTTKTASEKVTVFDSKENLQ